MTGLILYTYLATGIGFLLPAARLAGTGDFGYRFCLGNVSVLLGLFVCHVVARIPLDWVLALMALAAAAGLASATWRGQFEIRPHPAAILPLAAAVAILAHGRIDYLPYTVDEFTNWIGVSRLIHFAGSYEAIRETTYQAGYTPGWRLFLALPWRVGGEVVAGQSAAAAFILHVGAVGLFFDATRHVLATEGKLDARQTWLGAWALLLLFLAAEGMGKLWSRDLLIEAPQIYLLAATAILLFLASRALHPNRVLEAAAGLTLAAGYLMKSAALAALPALILVSLRHLWNRERPLRYRIRRAAEESAATIAPTLCIFLIWSLMTKEGGCIDSPLAVFSGRLIGYDGLDLAARFLPAMGGYIATYKLPLTLGALIGLVGMARRGGSAPILFLGGFFAAYASALYWYHLACFDEFLYRELNSIPRFTRVPLQALHAVGALLLIGLGARVVSLWTAQQLKTIFICMIAPLAAWQSYQLWASVRDVTTRIDQNVDPRISEMAAAARLLTHRAGKDLPQHPTLLVIGQGQDRDVLSYARYFALRQGREGPEQAFSVFPDSSWAPVPENTWQTRTDPGNLPSVFLSADLIWPLRLDTFTESVLTSLLVNPDCRARLPGVALLRVETSAGSRFVCESKGELPRRW